MAQPARRRGNARRGGRRRRRNGGPEGTEGSGEGAESEESAASAGADAAGAETDGASPERAGDDRDEARASGEAYGDGRQGRGRRRRRRGRAGREERATKGGAPEGAATENAKGAAKERDKRGGECVGLLVLDKGGHGKLRSARRGFLPDRKEDVHVAPRWVQRFKLREGMMIEGRFAKGMGQHKWDLAEISTIDGRAPNELPKVTEFKRLTSIDPDFHYEVGDLSKDTSMRVVDLICPVGRGQRGLIVAPPRSGKTVLLRKFASSIEEHYPDVHLMVLLVDERPEEATEWRRSTERGEVYVSTNDEPAKTHVELAEVVWKRCMRLVELGEDVILLLDSITRLARAYNNVHGNSGKTMSGGLDTRAMERPKGLFGSARNTETAGSLTILGTCLVETGSKMDQVIFEEFKGTGNMELVLSRKLADRRIFPAIDVERSGTRKEEKLLSSTRLRRIHTLRRVLSRMHFAEAMELLITKLDDVERNDDFLKRFDIDPEA
ncbi:MAG: transcription termination factor Rho [Planctomycetota bacterium]